MTFSSTRCALFLVLVSMIHCPGENIPNTSFKSDTDLAKQAPQLVGIGNALLL